MTAFTKEKPGPIDMHVHIVGDGSGGSGCWFRVKGWHWPLALFMVQHMGLPFRALRGDLDRLFTERLAELVRESSLEAAVILAHEQVYHEEGKRMEGAGSFYVPNDYVLSLARRYPQFLPAVSIHPARPDALEELERCLEGGAVLLKILPNCHNVDCNNRRYQPFWERMAESGLPLLAHTGGEHTVPVIRKEFADPRILRLPLECGVKVIAAHCGTKSGPIDPDYFQVWVEMLGKYPGLYGDNSAFNVPIRGRRVPECLREPMVSRILHGSDFPVPVFGHWSWVRRFISWQDFRRCEQIKNVIERDYQLKKAMGFPPESFTRIRSLLRQSKTSRVA